MRTPFKTLTVGLVLATAAMAGCSSTTAGSSGAVQNAATASASSASAAASSVASTAPAPSPDPVTPTAEPTGAPSSPIASPTDSSSPSPSGSSAGPALLGDSGPGSNDVCDAGLAYTCGDIGQSGVGTVFYASATAFACGTNMESSCNYLEVAPQKWNGKLVKCPGGCGGSPDSTSDFGSKGAGTGAGYYWCEATMYSKDYSETYISGASGTAVGSGYVNTSALITGCDHSGKKAETEDAGPQARGYTGGGKSDWSLPSKDELNALYYYTGRNAIGGFAASPYWSSSQYNSKSAWGQDFSNGFPEAVMKSAANAQIGLAYGVRPVRAF